MSWRENHYEASRREQAERDKLNQESKRRQALARARGELRKKKRDVRRERRRMLSGATSTKEKREIKREFDEIIEGIDTSIEANKKARDNEPQHDKSDDIVEGDSADSYLQEIADSKAFAHEVIASGATKIKVRYGQVANIDTSGTDPDISLATEYNVVNGSRIFIKVTVNQTTAQPTAAQIYVSTSVPSDSAGTAYLQLASVTVASGSITNIAQTASGSFDMLSSAAVHIFAKL